MRQLKLTSNNVEMSVNEWSTYIDNKSLNEIIAENIEGGYFRAKITITIEEVESGFQVTGNKPKEVNPDEEK